MSDRFIEKSVSVLLFTGFFLFVIISIVQADDAEVLPRGVFSARFTSLLYLPVNERYDPDGNIEDVAADYNGRLDSVVFPDLSMLEGPPFDLPTASIGNSVVSFEMEFVDLLFSFSYGITSRLTVGLEIPYSFQKNEVDARLATANATVGKNPFFGSPADPFGGAPLIPIAQGGIPLVEEDVQGLLGGGLDVDEDGTVDIPGLGYKRFQEWSESGFLDIDLGARYQYYKNDTWRLALTGGVRIPTGKVDDPDDLVDLEFGTGAWALFLHSNNDFIAVDDLLINATARYYIFFPNRETLRVPDDVNQPVTSNREKVDRDIGDVIDLELEGRYELFPGGNISLVYNFTHSFRDRVSGSRGFNYASLMDETEWQSHIFIAGLSFSTVQLYTEKKFPLPVSISLAYRNRFGGKNNALRTEFIKVAVQAFF